MSENPFSINRTKTEVVVMENAPSWQNFFQRALSGGGFSEVHVFSAKRNSLMDLFTNGYDRTAGVMIYSIEDGSNQAWENLERLRREFDGPILATTRNYDVSFQNRIRDMEIPDYVALKECNEESLLVKIDTVLAASRGHSIIDDNTRRNQNLFINILTVMVKVLDSKDPYTRWHSHNVAIRSRKLGRKIGLSEEELDRLGLAAVFHDFGKIGIPEAILHKAGRLTDEEFEVMKKHPVIARDLLCSLDLVRDLLPAILHHHERWDGNGYPDGLAGEQIPLWARIINMSDAYDTMSSRRTYKEPFTRERVVQELKKGRGTQFDPQLLDLFLEVLGEEKEYVPHPASQRLEKVE